MNCSKNGNEYELMIFNILKHVTINNSPFNNQIESDLGGSRSKNDIVCLFDNKSIGIEVKKYNTPDWMQCVIKLDLKTNKWMGSYRCKIPKKCLELFNNLLRNINIFDGSVPPFMVKKMTHEEWTILKKETLTWHDIYYDIPNDTIANLYQMKNCSYIQISEYGLYHLGNDICCFDVPKFIIDQQIRIRIKVHKRNHSKGFCYLSVTAACQPKNIKNLEKSKYSLDNISELPLSCTYNNNFR